jgi:hypothetical protein
MPSAPSHLSFIASSSLAFLLLGASFAPAQDKPLFDARSDALPVPAVFRDGDKVRKITGLALRIDDLDATKGKGALTIEEDVLDFNAYGDPTRKGGGASATFDVDFALGNSSAYEVLFADKRFPQRFWLRYDPNGRFGAQPGIAVQTKAGDENAFEFFPLHPLTVGADALGNPPLKKHFHFATMLPERQAEPDKTPRLLYYRLTLQGDLDKGGLLHIDPNLYRTEANGIFGGKTGIARAPMAITFKPLAGDPAKLGRRAFAVQSGEIKAPTSYVLVLGKNELDPHYLLVHENDRLLYRLRLEELDRAMHLEGQAALATTPAAEQQAIAALREVAGCRFSFTVADGHVAQVSSLGGDLARLDNSLRALKRLRSLGIHKTKLPAAGLAALKEMAALESLDFSDCDIEDAGLKSLAGTTSLKHLIFYGCNGPTAAGMSHFAGLANLETLRIIREDDPKEMPLLDDGLKHLKTLTKLHYLSLYGQRVTYAGLAHLSELRQLREVNLKPGTLHPPVKP